MISAEGVYAQGLLTAFIPHAAAASNQVKHKVSLNYGPPPPAEVPDQLPVPPPPPPVPSAKEQKTEAGFSCSSGRCAKKKGAQFRTCISDPHSKACQKLVEQNIIMTCQRHTALQHSTADRRQSLPGCNNNNIEEITWALRFTWSF